MEFLIVRSEAAYSFEVGGRRGEPASVSINANSLQDGFYSLRLAMFVGSSSSPVTSVSLEFMFITQQDRVIYRSKPPSAFFYECPPAARWVRSDVAACRDAY